MPRPPIPLRAGWADKSHVMDTWNTVPPLRRMRLHALMLIWDADPGETRARLSEMLGISRRQLSRWVKGYNEGGIQGLIYPERQRPGRKLKISVQDFNSKLVPLLSEIGEQKTAWSIAEVRRQLGAQYQIHVSASTLRRRLRQSGYSPAPLQQKQPIQSPWTLPWPQEYGASHKEYLQRQAGQSSQAKTDTPPQSSSAITPRKPTVCTRPSTITVPPANRSITSRNKAGTIALHIQAQKV